MSGTVDLVNVLKAELKRARLTYADLSVKLGLAESTVKRMFARGDMPLQRVDEICRALNCDFSDVARQVAEREILRSELSQAQEQELVSDEHLLVVGLCVLSQWTFGQIAATYALSDAEVVHHLARLDRLGVIELRPLNRYRLRLQKTFRWRPDGPVMRYFRAHGVADYFSGGFDGTGEMLALVHGQLSPASARVFQERLQRFAEDFARQHLADQRLPAGHKQGFAALVSMRSWMFEPLRALLRQPGGGG